MKIEDKMKMLSKSELELILLNILDKTNKKAYPSHIARYLIEKYYLLSIGVIVNRFRKNSIKQAIKHNDWFTYNIIITYYNTIN